MYNLSSDEKRKLGENGFKVSENGYQELHLDLDEANALLLKEGDEVTIEI